MLRLTISYIFFSSKIILMFDNLGVFFMTAAIESSTRNPSEEEKFVDLAILNSALRRESFGSPWKKGSHVAKLNPDFEVENERPVPVGYERLSFNFPFSGRGAREVSDEELVFDVEEFVSNFAGKMNWLSCEIFGEVTVVRPTGLFPLIKSYYARAVVDVVAQQ